MIQKVFLGAAGLDLVALIFYAFFASGEIQAWAVDHSYQEANVKMPTVTTVTVTLSDKGA